MSRSRSAVLALLLVAGVAVAFVVSEVRSGSASPYLNMVLIHTNNVEGELEPCSCVSDPAGGAARRSSAVGELRKRFRNLFLVDSGDALFGTPESDDSQGLIVVDTMNAMGYDAAALGDQDFSYGLPALQAAIHESKFPYLSANVVHRDTKQPFVQESVVLERAGFRVAFIGLTSQDLEKILQADPAMKSTLEVLDPIATARQKVPALRKQADMVVVLSHLGSELDEKLVRSVSGIDAVIGAHSREVMAVDHKGLSTPIVQVGYQGDLLGVLKLAVDQQGRVLSAHSANIRLDGKVPSDQRIQAIVMPYKARAALNGTIGFYQGLSPLLPLEVHRASHETQRAYLGALGYPTLFKGEAYPGTAVQLNALGGQRPESLLDCFVKPTETTGPQVDFSLLGIDELACVQRANALLDGLPKPSLPARIGRP